MRHARARVRRARRAHRPLLTPFAPRPRAATGAAYILFYVRRDVAAGWRAALAAEDREDGEGDEAAPASAPASAPAPAAAPYRVPEHLRVHSDRGAEGDGVVPPLSAQQVRRGGVRVAGGARERRLPRGRAEGVCCGASERSSERASARRLSALVLLRALKRARVERASMCRRARCSPALAALAALTAAPSSARTSLLSSQLFPGARVPCEDAARVLEEVARPELPADGVEQGVATTTAAGGAIAGGIAAVLGLVPGVGRMAASEAARGAVNAVGEACGVA